MRRSALVLVVGLTAALLAGCGSSSEQRDAARTFLDAWARGDVPAAAAVTDECSATACGVTPQAVALKSKPTLMITHSPGHMFITDLRDEDLAVL